MNKRQVTAVDVASIIALIGLTVALLVYVGVLRVSVSVQEREINRTIEILTKTDTDVLIQDGDPFTLHVEGTESVPAVSYQGAYVASITRELLHTQRVTLEQTSPGDTCWYALWGVSAIADATAVSLSLDTLVRDGTLDGRRLCEEAWMLGNIRILEIFPFELTPTTPIRLLPSIFEVPIGQPYTVTLGEVLSWNPSPFVHGSLFRDQDGTLAVILNIGRASAGNYVNVFEPAEVHLSDIQRTIGLLVSDVRILLQGEKITNPLEAIQLIMRARGVFDPLWPYGGNNTLLPEAEHLQRIASVIKVLTPVLELLGDDVLELYVLYMSKSEVRPDIETEHQARAGNIPPGRDMMSWYYQQALPGLLPELQKVTRGILEDRR